MLLSAVGGKQFLSGCVGVAQPLCIFGSLQPRPPHRKHVEMSLNVRGYVGGQQKWISEAFLNALCDVFVFEGIDSNCVCR